VWTTEVVPHPLRYEEKTNTLASTPTLSSLSLYSLNSNLCRAPPLTSNHLCPSTRCQALYIGPLGRWLQEGVLVGEREVQWLTRRCGRASRWGWPSNFHHLWSCVRDLVLVAVCGSISSMKEVRPYLLLWSALSPLVIFFGSCSSR
jgi:hypothetical protein